MDKTENIRYKRFNPKLSNQIRLIWWKWKQNYIKIVILCCHQLFLQFFVRLDIRDYGLYPFFKRRNPLGNHISNTMLSKSRIVISYHIIHLIKKSGYSFREESHVHVRRHLNKEFSSFAY